MTVCAHDAEVHAPATSNTHRSTLLQVPARGESPESQLHCSRGAGACCWSRGQTQAPDECSHLCCVNANRLHAARLQDGLVSLTERHRPCPKTQHLLRCSCRLRRGSRRCFCCVRRCDSYLSTKPLSASENCLQSLLPTRWPELRLASLFGLTDVRVKVGKARPQHARPA